MVTARGATEHVCTVGLRRRGTGCPCAATGLVTVRGSPAPSRSSPAEWEAPGDEPTSLVPSTQESRQ